MASYYVGIDLGGTAIKLGIVNETGNIITKLEAPTPVNNYYGTLDKFVAMIEETGFGMDEMVGIGIGLPGFVDIETGIIENLPNIGWNQVQIQKDLEDKVKIPVYIENDANAAALGEMWQGAGKNHKNLLCVTVGTGVGAGVVIKGDIYHGKGAMAGEIGHIPINPIKGKTCNCGKVGCLETEASATAMVEMAKEQMRKGRETILDCDLTAKGIFEAAKENDQLAVEIINHVTFYLGLVLSQLSHVIAPDIIIIGGGVANAKEMFLEPIKKHFVRFSLPKIAGQTEIKLARLGNDAGIIGAAWLVHRNK